MNICFSVTNLERGGAQTFVLRLAEELSKDGRYRIFVYDHWPEFRQLAVPGGIKMACYARSTFVRSSIWKINALLKRMGLHKGFRHAVNRHRFQRFLHENRINILNSHALFSDLVIASVKLPEDCRYIPTLHGEYELMFHEDQSGMKVNKDLLGGLHRKSAAVIYTAEKNRTWFDEHFPSAAPRLRINVGINPDSYGSPSISRRDVGLEPRDFVLGMVSRGIPEKGWSTGIQILKNLNAKNNVRFKLFMVGEGDYLKSLLAEAADKNIILAPQLTGNGYYAYYALFDIFLFPSTFKGESMPIAVIEALNNSVPVIATRHAELPYMLCEGSSAPCGVTVDITLKLAEDMEVQVLRLYNDRSALRQLALNCAPACKKFDLINIKNQYLKVFLNAMS